MRVLVTGATGFVGRHAVRALRADGHDVLPLVRNPDAVLASFGDWRGAVLIGNVCDPAVIDQVAGCDVVLHLAAFADAGASRGDPVPAASVNATGTLYLLEGARRAGAGFVLTSSQHVYRGRLPPLSEDAPKQPTTPYGYSKLVAELWTQMYSQLFGVASTVIRLFSVYGPGQVARGKESGVVSIFAQRALQGEPLVVNSRARRDFTHVADAVAGIRLLLGNPAARGGVYNVATGVGTAPLELAHQIVQACGSASEVVDEAHEDDQNNRVADIRPAQALGYVPSIGLADGIRDYVRWLRTAREGTPESTSHSGTAR